MIQTREDIKIKTPCRGRQPLLNHGQSLPCWGALHTMQCNAAPLMRPCMTHCTVTASLSCGFMRSLHLVSPASSFLTVPSHTLHKESSVQRALRQHQSFVRWKAADLWGNSCRSMRGFTLKQTGEVLSSSLWPLLLPLDFEFSLALDFKCTGGFSDLWLIVYRQWQTKLWDGIGITI